MSTTNRLLKFISKPFTRYEALSYKLQTKIQNIRTVLESIESDIAELNILRESITDSDEESRLICAEELRSLRNRQDTLTDDAKSLILPDLMNEVLEVDFLKPGFSPKGAIVQIRAGNGGEEACMFAHSILQMYQNVADQKNWRHTLVEYQPLSANIGTNALRSAILQVDQQPFQQQSVFNFFLLENGAHRVKRVPQTEVKGRIHTSTAIVNTLPILDIENLVILPQDIKIDTFRSGGKGGQHVNTTDSAVRAVHIPTGITASIQNSRSQHQNKTKALTLLASRVKMYQEEKAQHKRKAVQNIAENFFLSDDGKPSRTYHFVQNYVSDHRIGLQVKKGNPIIDILEGSLLVDEINPLLQADFEAKRVEALLEHLES